MLVVESEEEAKSWLDAFLQVHCRLCFLFICQLREFSEQAQEFISLWENTTSDDFDNAVDLDSWNDRETYADATQASHLELSRRLKLIPESIYRKASVSFIVPFTYNIQALYSQPLFDVKGKQVTVGSILEKGMSLFVVVQSLCSKLCRQAVQRLVTPLYKVIQQHFLSHVNREQWTNWACLLSLLDMDRSMKLNYWRKKCPTWLVRASDQSFINSRSGKYLLWIFYL